MINLKSEWIADNLRIVIFGDDFIPFKEKETSYFLTENHISASIKQDENGESVIKEATSLKDNSVFSLSYFEKQNIIEFSLDIDKENKEGLLDKFFAEIVHLVNKFYDNNSFKVKRLGVISSFYQDNFNAVKNAVSTNFLKDYDDFDIRLNKSSKFNEIKINQAVSLNSSERLFLKIEEPFNIPVPNMKKVVELVIDVNTDVENGNIEDFSTILIKLAELSNQLIDNGGGI